MVSPVTNPPIFPIVPYRSLAFVKKPLGFLVTPFLGPLLRKPIYNSYKIWLAWSPNSWNPDLLDEKRPEETSSPMTFIVSYVLFPQRMLPWDTKHQVHLRGFFWTRRKPSCFWAILDLHLSPKRVFVVAVVVSPRIFHPIRSSRLKHQLAGELQKTLWWRPQLLKINGFFCARL